MRGVTKAECLECGAICQPRVEVRVEEYPVKGEPVEVTARVAVCPECGEDMSVEELDDATLRTAFNVYRQRHGLMSPEEMVRLRDRYGLGVRPFSLLLGWGEITLHRYESGSLQDSAHEAALRMAEDPANVRILLQANGHKLTARQRARLERALESLEAQRVEPCRTSDRFEVREEQDEYGGWLPMQISKLREMMLYFCKLPDTYPTKLNKLLFFSDFLHFREQSVSISGSPYLAMPRGPVPEHYDWVIADLIEGGDLSAEEVYFESGATGELLRPLREPDLSLFSPAELTTVRLVAEELGRRTSRQLTELSHQEAAWRETPQRQRISYAWAKESAL
ncbi:MAG: DUF4065 domain-containing protein [Coriobacteriia bacterium]|nr:DUF4065 domain-containing protein [Coriobacteriia bacterium]